MCNKKLSVAVSSPRVDINDIEETEIVAIYGYDEILMNCSTPFLISRVEEMLGHGCDFRCVGDDSTFDAIWPSGFNSD
jgi:hypothetical protein